MSGFKSAQYDMATGTIDITPMVEVTADVPEPSTSNSPKTRTAAPAAAAAVAGAAEVEKNESTTVAESS